MAIIFLHGVNVRKGPAYDRDTFLRDRMIRRYLLPQLATQDADTGATEILNPYWGDEGARFRWQNASVPSLATLQSLGSNSGVVEPRNCLPKGFAQEISSRISVANEVSGQTTRPAHGSDLVDRDDLLSLAERMVLPVITGEFALSTSSSPLLEADAVASLLDAIARVTADEATILRARAAGSEDAVASILSHAIQQDMAVRSTTEARNPGVQSMGQASELTSILRRVEEMLSRTVRAPNRALSSAFLSSSRLSVHESLARANGDSLVYINERGTRSEPGPIVQVIVGALRKASSDDGPLVVLTHSMGGNIFYDVMTHYAPDLKVDIWISVGGQVAQFEEMKLFKVSDPAVSKPQKVDLLADRVPIWINVYDPVDVLSFKVSPVFSAVSADIPYGTGAGLLDAHSCYFARPSFYRAVGNVLSQSLTRRNG